MSIFNYEQTLADIKEGKESIPLICLKCKSNMAVTNYDSFGCQKCQTRYTFESYQLQFNSMFMSLLLNGMSGGGQNSTQQTVTTTQKTEVKKETAPTTTTLTKPQIDMSYFNTIFSFDDIKHILIDMVNLDDIASEKDLIHALIHGPPGQGKTVFLKALQKFYGNRCKFVTGNQMTKSGLTSALLNGETYDALLIDEIDKMEEKDQVVLLGVMQDGEINETKFRKDRSASLNMKVFATCNDIENIYPALKDRFWVLTQNKYTKDEFYNIGRSILKAKYSKKFDESMIDYMLSEFYTKMSKNSMRDLVDKIGKMAKTKEDIDFYIKTMSKYTTS